MQWLIDLLVQGFLKKIWDLIVSQLALIKRRQAKDTEIDKRTSEQSENLKKSQTDEEDEKAARDILNRHE
jgi:hypothetical protein